jgi:hypothetical protein
VTDLPDAEARRRILTDFGQTFFVEAAAGTGKTLGAFSASRQNRSAFLSAAFAALRICCSDGCSGATSRSLLLGFLAMPLSPGYSAVAGFCCHRAPAVPFYFPITFRSASLIRSCQPGPAS